MEKGKQQGIAEGMEKGVKSKSIEIAKNLLESGLDINFVSKHTNLSIEELEDLK